MNCWQNLSIATNNHDSAERKEITKKENGLGVMLLGIVLILFSLPVVLRHRLQLVVSKVKGFRFS